MYTKNDDLLLSLKGIVEGEKNLIANLSNISSVIFNSLPELNWVGFYFWSKIEQELVLGPFQGQPACIRIKANKGVCGACYTTKKVQLVPDVSLFSGHIACDSATNSELVIPLFKDPSKNECLGVLDLDSPKFNRFNQQDVDLIEKCVDQVIAKLDWSALDKIY